MNLLYLLIVGVIAAILFLFSSFLYLGKVIGIAGLFIVWTLAFLFGMTLPLFQYAKERQYFRAEKEADKELRTWENQASRESLEWLNATLGVQIFKYKADTAGCWAFVKEWLRVYAHGIPKKYTYPENHQIFPKYKVYAVELKPQDTEMQIKWKGKSHIFMLDLNTWLPINDCAEYSSWMAFQDDLPRLEKIGAFNTESAKLVTLNLMTQMHKAGLAPVLGLGASVPTTQQ